METKLTLRKFCSNKGLDPAFISRLENDIIPAPSKELLLKTLAKEDGMSKNHNDGFWYWMTLIKPTNYWFAKIIGGDAEEQADAAMEDLVAPALVILVIIIVWGIGELLGLW